MRRYKLNTGRFTVVDEDVYSALKVLNMNVREDCKGYAKISGTKTSNKNQSRFLHQVLLAEKPLDCVDHVNGNPLDNRRCNLRVSNPSNNIANSKETKGKYPKGVHKMKSRHGDKKFYCRVCKNGKRHFRGYFRTIAEAKKAHMLLHLELYKENSYYNND